MTTERNKSTNPTLIKEAKLLFAKKKYSDAISKLNQLKKPKTAEEKDRQLILAAICVRSGEIEKGLALLSEIEKKFQKGKSSKETINIRAIAYRSKNELKKAEELLREGFEQYPDCVDLAHNLSVTAADLGHFQLAEEAGKQALKINPRYFETYKNLGRVYVTTRATQKAREIFDKLNQLQPNNVDSMVGFGAIELLHSNASQASQYFQNALAINDTLSAAWANLGICSKYMGDYESAKKYLEIAVKKDPQQVEHLWNLSLVNLGLGNFEEGWQQYEVRYDPRRNTPDAVKLPNTKIPMLKPVDSAHNKTIILVQEQGFGDTFQFFRFAKNLKEEGVKKIIAIVAKEMIEVIRTVPWIDEVRTEIKTINEIPDYWVFSMSLPARYQIKTVKQIPAFTRYLSVEHKAAKNWQQQLGVSNKMRVGLVWAGRETHSNDANRSLSIKTLEPLLQLHNQIEFISLQKGAREADIEGDKRIKSCGAALNSFADTAALLASLDLLISVDSSPVHLAGALGMPVWALIPSIFDFRWLINREDSPWYPSMRLYRQKIGQTWDEVVMRMKQDLQALIRNRPAHWQADRYHLFPALELKQSNLAGINLFIHSAFQYHLGGNLKIAELMYVKTLKYEPHSLDAIRNLAALYRSVGDLNKSESIYRYGENKGMRDPIFFTNYANLLMDLGRFDEARMKADIALTINRMHTPASEVKQRLAQLSQNVG